MTSTTTNNDYENNNYGTIYFADLHSSCVFLLSLHCLLTLRLIDVIRQLDVCVYGERTVSGSFNMN